MLESFDIKFGLNLWMDFGLIIHACFLGDPLSKLLKPLRSVEQNGRQGYQ